MRRDENIVLFLAGATTAILIAAVLVGLARISTSLSLFLGALGGALVAKSAEGQVRVRSSLPNRDAAEPSPSSQDTVSTQT